MRKLLYLLLSLLLCFSSVYATTITFSHTFVDGEVLTASLLETMKSDITAVVNAGGGPVGLTNTQTVSGTKTFSGSNTHSGNNTFSGNNTLSGTNSHSGTNTFSGAVTFNNTINASAATFSTATPVQFEGSSANDFETSIAVTDPTGDRTITLPNASVTVGTTRSTVITATRNMADGSGNVAYTGCGFTPTKLSVVYGVNDSTTGGGVGFADDSGAAGSVNILGTVYESTNRVIYVVGASEGNRQEATVNSWDTDGFTLAWTLTGGPTGTLTMIFECTI